jgi:hypothetical protein
MNRKDKTVKQLQAECKKRKVGFMMNWTKVALTKRLEDEDTRELDIKKVEDKASKEINKAKKELKSIQTIHSENLIELEKSNPKIIEKQVRLKILDKAERKLKTLQDELSDLQTGQREANQTSNRLARESIEVAKEIKALEFSIENLK